MKCLMKTLLIVAVALCLAPASAFASSPFADGEVMVMAAGRVELDITMEMVDEDVDTSADVVNILELPVQEMHQEQLRNERHIRQSGEASSLQLEHGSSGKAMDDIREVQQEAEDAKRKAAEEMGQKKGQ